MVVNNINLSSAELTKRVVMVMRSIYIFIMPPTSKKLERHIASGLFICLSVRPSVRSSRFLMHSITLKPCFEISYMDAS